MNEDGSKLISNLGLISPNGFQFILEIVHASAKVVDFSFYESLFLVELQNQTTIYVGQHDAFLSFEEIAHIIER